MITDKDIEKLLSLSRIAVSPEEKEKLKKDIESILGYVSDIQNAKPTEGVVDERLVNVMREDGVPHESGIYTEKILKQAPNREGNHVAVKKIM